MTVPSDRPNTASRGSALTRVPGADARPHPVIARLKGRIRPPRRDASLVIAGYVGEDDDAGEYLRVYDTLQLTGYYRIKRADVLWVEQPVDSNEADPSPDDLLRPSLVTVRENASFDHHWLDANSAAVGMMGPPPPAGSARLSSVPADPLTAWEPRLGTAGEPASGSCNDDF